MLTIDPASIEAPSQGDVQVSEQFRALFKDTCIKPFMNGCSADVVALGSDNIQGIYEELVLHTLDRGLTYPDLRTYTAAHDVILELSSILDTVQKTLPNYNDTPTIENIAKWTVEAAKEKLKLEEKALEQP